MEASLGLLASHAPCGPSVLGGTHKVRTLQPLAKDQGETFVIRFFKL